MKTSPTAALAAALALAWPTLAAAQQSPPPTTAPPATVPPATTTPAATTPPPASPSPVERQFADMDRNDDGRVTADEHATAMQALFADMDEDDNGELSTAELDAAYGPQRDGTVSSADRIRPMDLNGDGMLSSEEHRRGMEGQFQRNDANRDDGLDLAEMKSSTGAIPTPP
jgi:hypothetical protein